MRLKLFLVLTIATLSQLTNSGIARAESARMEQLTADLNIANLTLDRFPIKTIKDIPGSTDLIAKSRRKSRKPQSTANTPTPKPDTIAAPAKIEAQAIVSEIVITTDRGQLEPALAAKIRQVLTIRAGQSVTRTQLEQNLNVVKALGDFATVQIVPEDTATGVKISFLVKPYGTLTNGQLRTLPANSSSILPATTIAEIFKPQYGRKLNAIELKAAVAKLTQLYQNQGYNLAQVVDIEELSPDGKVTLVIAEGSIEDIRVRFLNKKGEATDENKQPYTGQTRPFIITREAESKPGKIFNRNTVEKDLRRIYGLGLFEDVRVSFAQGSDPAKVVLQYDVIERNKTLRSSPMSAMAPLMAFLPASTITS